MWALIESWPIEITSAQSFIAERFLDQSVHKGTRVIISAVKLRGNPKRKACQIRPTVLGWCVAVYTVAALHWPHTSQETFRAAHKAEWWIGWDGF